MGRNCSPITRRKTLFLRLPSSSRAARSCKFQHFPKYSTLVLTLIDNIPVRALSLVPSHDLLDVVLHNAYQRRVVVDLVDPTRQLAVPYKRVASHLLAALHSLVYNCRQVGVCNILLLGVVGNLVSAVEVELSTVGLGSIPFHRYGLQVSEQTSTKKSTETYHSRE
jgi:hypothetical protein